MSRPLPGQPDDWSPPPELCGSTPRRVKWKGSGVANLVLAYVIGIIGFLLVCSVFATAEQDHQLKQDGQVIEATVTRKWSESTKSTTYHVAYAFSIGGKAEKGESGISHRLWQTLSVGSHLPVNYVPSQPEVNRAAAAYQRLLPYWVPWAAFLIWACFLALAVSPIRKEKRLARFGVPAFGIVTNTTGGRRPKYGYTIKYEFQLPDGSTVTGRTQRDSWLYNRQNVSIVYDPKRPRRNAIYPLKLIRVEEKITATD